MDILLPTAVYLLGAMMAYDFFEILLEGSLEATDEGSSIPVLASKSAKITLGLMAAVWPYYVIKNSVRNMFFKGE